MNNLYEQIRDARTDSERLTQLSFRGHVTGNPEHVVEAGYHRRVINPVTGVENYVVWLDAAMRIKRLEVETKWNTTPGLEYEIKYMRKTYYDKHGSTVRVLHYTNYEYDGDELIAWDVSEEVSEVLI